MVQQVNSLDTAKRHAAVLSQECPEFVYCVLIRIIIVLCIYLYYVLLHPGKRNHQGRVVGRRSEGEREAVADAFAWFATDWFGGGESTEHTSGRCALGHCARAFEGLHASRLNRACGAPGTARPSPR